MKKVPRSAMSLMSQNIKKLIEKYKSFADVSESETLVSVSAGANYQARNYSCINLKDCKITLAVKLSDDGNVDQYATVLELPKFRMSKTSPLLPRKTTRDVARRHGYTYTVKRLQSSKAAPGSSDE